MWLVLMEEELKATRCLLTVLVEEELKVTNEVLEEEKATERKVIVDQVLMED